MSKRRVALGASIVGVVVVAVGLTVFAIGPQVGSESVATPDPDVTTGSAPKATPATDERSPATEPPATVGDTVADTAPDAAPGSLEPTSAPRTTVARAVPDVIVTNIVTNETTIPAATFEFADASTCPTIGRAAVVDREHQRAWLCGEGLVTHEMPITSAWIQPDPGDYSIYARDMNSSSRFTGKYSTMTHFVAFTHGKIRGARIAFHSVPTYADGSFVQPLESVGTPEQRGNSAGCIRVLPADAELIWSWLEIGDLVRVIS